MRSIPQTEMSEDACAVADGVCSVHGEIVRKAMAEVIALRGRVAQLELVLNEPETRMDPAHTDDVDEQTETGQMRSIPLREFQAAGAPAAQAPPTDPGVEPFAEAWTRENATFDERFAARTFFDSDAVDERSRRWFLKSS